jgi:two-component system cell cycle response regulator
MTIIKLLFQTMQLCRELAMQFALVGNAHIIAECKGFEDTRNWSFFEAMLEARQFLSVKNVATPAKADGRPVPLATAGASS